MLNCSHTEQLVSLALSSAFFRDSYSSNFSGFILKIRKESSTRYDRTISFHDDEGRQCFKKLRGKREFSV
jgi:hypothetical protein